MVVAVFLSVIAFAVVAGLVAVALIYLLWVTRRGRRAMRDQVIEGEVKGRDIQ
jgi:heme/copper-type cytochrome/quinol oxidase subunit 2